MNTPSTSIKSALVSTVLMAIVAILTYVIGIGDIFKIQIHALINIGFLSLATGFVSLIKNFLTNGSGNFAGIVKVADVPPQV